MNKVTLVVTSCGRIDLLERTLESFFKVNTYPITETIIVEDSGVPQNFNTIQRIVPTTLTILINDTNIGQVASIDKAYAEVKTDYIFHCEDDWEFFKPGFIEKSLRILNNDTNLFTVWLRGHEDTKNHAIMWDERFNILDDHYYLMDPARKKHWCGFTWNPGLRRTSDCMIFHPYMALEVRKEKNGLNILGEIDLSIYYQELGYRAAITSDPEGYIRHIGGKRHIPLPWQL